MKQFEFKHAGVQGRVTVDKHGSRVTWAGQTFSVGSAKSGLRETILREASKAGVELKFK